MKMRSVRVKAERLLPAINSQSHPYQPKVRLGQEGEAQDEPNGGLNTASAERVFSATNAGKEPE
jgi:hypothetical protein